MADFAASFCAATKKGRHCRRYWRPFFGFHCIHIIDPMWCALGRLPFQTQYFCSYCLKVYQESLYKDNWTLINILNSEELPLTRSDSSFSQEGCFSMLERPSQSFSKKLKTETAQRARLYFHFCLFLFMPMSKVGGIWTFVFASILNCSEASPKNNDKNVLPLLPMICKL